MINQLIDWVDSGLTSGCDFDLTAGQRIPASHPRQVQPQLLLDRYSALEIDLPHCCEKKQSMQMKVMRQLLRHPPRDCRKRLGAGEIACRDELIAFVQYACCFDAFESPTC